MFNKERNTAARDAMRATVEAGDQDWRKDVSKRYGKFLQGLVQRDTDTLTSHKKNPAIQTDKGRAYIADQEVSLSERAHMAKGYISGVVLLKDPVDTEVTLRLYAQAATPPKPKD